MNQETKVLTGVVSDLKVIPTRTGRSMVTLTVSGRKCKAFGNLADTCAALDGEQVQINAREGSFRGEKEYAIISLKATVDGQEVSATDTRTVPAAQSVPPRGPVPAGMVRWHARPGERAQFRSEIVKYGNARMLEIFDRLPHPVCKEEEWAELIEEMRKHEKAHAEELRNYARSLGYTEEEIAEYSANRAYALGWTVTKSSFIAGLDSRRKTYGKRNAHEAEFQREPVTVAASSSGAERPPCSTERKASAQVASAPASQPEPARTETLTDDFTEVPAGSMTFEQMEAEYRASQERGRLEQTAESPAATA